MEFIKGDSKSIMKKCVVFLFTIVISAMLCGCGATIPDMTEAQTAYVTEYATGLLVKYSAVSDRTLLNEKELEEGLAKEAEERERLLKIKELEEAYRNGTAEKLNKEENEGDVSNKESQTVEVVPQLSVAEFFAEDSFSIEYTSYTLCQSYPEKVGEDFFMAMDATPGKKLCIVKFNVRNLTSADQSIDMYEKRGRFSLKLEDGSVVSAQSTLLMDDLSSYTGTIPGGAAEELVLVFEVPDTVSQIGKMDLIMSNQTDNNTLTLQ